MAEMLVNPEDKRTKGEKIKAAGLTERTFYRWMSDERYIDYVNSLVDKFTNAELPDIWKALVRKAKMGDTAAVKLVYELRGMMPEFAHKKEMDRARLEIDKAKLLLEVEKAKGENKENKHVNALRQKMAERKISNAKQIP